MNYEKGEIVLADLGKNFETHIQQGQRPVVILQNETGNRYSDTTIIAPLTKKMKKIQQPTHIVIMSDNSNNLNNDSIVLLEQIQTIDKSKIMKKLGVVTENDLHKIDEGLKKSLNLGGIKMEENVKEVYVVVFDFIWNYEKGDIQVNLFNDKENALKCYNEFIKDEEDEYNERFEKEDIEETETKYNDYTYSYCINQKGDYTRYHSEIMLYKQEVK